jgi:hypothetical protein
MKAEAQNQSLVGQSEYNIALDQLCALAHQNLYLFDRDFELLGFNSTIRFEVLRQFLRASTTSRLYLLAHNPKYLQTHCARMEMLLAQFSHRIQISQTPKNLQHLSESFAVADQQHCLRRFHFDRAVGTLELNHPEQAGAYQARFLEMGAHAKIAVYSARLGL